MVDWRDYAVPEASFDKSDWRSYAVPETSVHDKSDWRSYATYEAAAPEPPAPQGSFLGNIARSVATGAGAALGGITSAAGYVARKFDSANPVEPERVFDRAGVPVAGDTRPIGTRLSDALLEEGAKAQEMARGWSADVPRNLVNQTAEGIGSMLPYAMAGGAAGLAARGSAAVAGLARAELETQANAAQTYQDMRRAGYDDEAAMRAARRQEWPDRAVNAALEPFGALSGRSRPVRALAEAVQEGVLQEPAQNITSAAAQRSAEGGLWDFAGALADEARNYPQHFREVGLPAMIAGGIVGGISPGVRGRQEQQAQTAQAQQGTQQSDASELNLSNPNSDVDNLSSVSGGWHEPEMPEGTGTTSRKVNDVRKIIERVTGMPVREGQIRKKNVLGFINHTSEVIRSKSPNDIATMLHEFGHAMDRRFGISEKNGRAFEELNAFGRAMGYPQNLWHSEGLAQFFQWRGVDPEQAYQQFPEYSKAFDAFLAENPEAKAAIDEVFNASQEYYHASPEARLNAAISDGRQERRSIREWGRDTWREARRQLFDRQAPFAEINKMVAGKLGVSREMIPDKYNLEAAARTMPGTQAVIDDKVNSFVKNFDGFTPEEYESLKLYMAAGGGLDYFNNGMNPGLGLAAPELRGIRERTPEKIKQAAARMREEYDRMMDETLVDAGLISKKMIQKWREKYPNYVPMLADNADGSVSLLTPQQARARGYVSLDNPVKKRSGVKNDRDVVMRRDPVQTMLENYKRYGDVAARNRVGQVLINISKLPGMARVAEKVPDMGRNTFYVWQNGKRRRYATDPELYAAFRSLDEMGVPKSDLVRFAHNVARGMNEAFKAGTTRYNPWFILRNLIRDSFTVGLQSRASVKDWRGAPIVNTFDAIVQMVGKDEKTLKLLEEAREDGLFYSSLVEMNRQNIPRLVEKHLKGGRFKETLKRLEQAADRVGEWNEIVEVAPKFREYKRLREMGVPRKQATMMGREVNTDFQRSGLLVRSLNQYVPFLNAQVQGLDKVVRTFKDHPVESMMKTGLYIMLPSVLEWALYHDDEDYKALDKEIKDTHWVFRLPGAAPDDWVRVPMPFEVGVLLGGGTKRALDAILEKDPAWGYKFWESLSEAFLIGPTDLLFAVLKPFIEIWANKSSFMDRPIVPRREQGLPDRLQYGSSTSYLAKQAGQLGFSPRNVDHIIRSFGGSMGAQAAHVFDVLDRGRAPMPARNWHESTLFRPYTISSDTSNHYIDRFYTVTDELSKGESGAKLEKVRYENAALADFMQGRQRALGKIWREIAAVREARGMSPEAKAERIDRLSKRAGEIAKRSLEIYDKHVK